MLLHTASLGMPAASRTRRCTSPRIAILAKCVEGSCWLPWTTSWWVDVGGGWTWGITAAGQAGSNFKWVGLNCLVRLRSHPNEPFSESAKIFITSSDLTKKYAHLYHRCRDPPPFVCFLLLLLYFHLLVAHAHTGCRVLHKI